MLILARAVFIGMVIAMVGTIPRNIVFFANLRIFPQFPWAVPVTAVYMWFFFRYLNGDGPPPENSAERRESLRARAISGRSWFWSLVAGGLAIVALVLALRLLNRFVALPPQTLPPFTGVSRFTVIGLLLMSAPVAGIIEESAFRGYMQGPLERRFGLAIAILITGTMFAVAHLDFTPILWPYYVAVAAIYGAVTSFTRSILPAMLLHTAGNLYSNFDLYLHGQAEWQAPPSEAASIWRTGPDPSFWLTLLGLAVIIGLTLGAFRTLRSLYLTPSNQTV